MGISPCGGGIRKGQRGPSLIFRGIKSAGISWWLDMWVRRYKTPELWSINALYILQSESDTLMQKGYYYSREHTFVRAGSSGEDSDPLSATSHDVAESLKGNIQCTQVSASSA